MKIYEKIFARLEELHMSQIELSRRTGIPASTINDWKKKGINPQSDKLTAICKALNMSLGALLYDGESKDEPQADYSEDEKYIIECYRRTDSKLRKKLIKNLELVVLANSIKDGKRSVSIVQDLDGNSIVLINDKKFKGLTKNDWKEIEKYLMGYIGEFYEIAYCSEKVFIDTDFPDEYANSKSRIALKGPRRTAKANAAQAIPELVQIATPAETSWQENKEKKHSKDAKFGWYRYKVRFGIPVYNNSGELERYNIYSAIMLVRHDRDGKKYLYDLTTIKKETSSPLES